MVLRHIISPCFCVSRRSKHMFFTAASSGHPSRHFTMQFISKLPGKSKKHTRPSENIPSENVGFTEIEWRNNIENSGHKSCIYGGLFGQMRHLSFLCVKKGIYK